MPISLNSPHFWDTLDTYWTPKTERFYFQSRLTSPDAADTYPSGLLWTGLHHHKVRFDNLAEIFVDLCPIDHIDLKRQVGFRECITDTGQFFRR